MRMMIWASRTPEQFLIHVRGMICAIKEMELDTKFQEAVTEVEFATLEVKLSKMAYKDELKNRGQYDAPKQAGGVSKAAPDKSKTIKKAEGDKSPQPAVVAAKAALNEAQKARNEAQE